MQLLQLVGAEFKKPIKPSQRAMANTPDTEATTCTTPSQSISILRSSIHDLKMHDLRERLRIAEALNSRLQTSLDELQAQHTSTQQAASQAEAVARDGERRAAAAKHKAELKAKQLEAEVFCCTRQLYNKWEERESDSRSRSF